MREELKHRIERINTGVIPEGYKKTKVGIVPDLWDILQYKKILNVCSGKAQFDVECEEGKYPILGTGGEFGRTNDFLYDKPSVLIGRKGTINKPQYMESPFWTVDTLFYTKLSDSVVPKYIYYNFCMVNWLKYNEASGVPSLSSSTIQNIYTVLPSLPEQQKIAEILSTQDKLIELKQKLIDLKKQQKIWIMQELLTRKKRLNGFSGEWKKVKLGEICKISAGGDIDKNHCQLYKNEKFQYPVYANAFANKGLYGYSDIFKISGETVTVTGRGEIGFAIARSEKYYPIVRLLVLEPKKRLNIIFLEHEINIGKIYMESTGVPQLTAPQLALLKVYCPPIEEQTAIAEILSQQDKEIELLEKELDLQKKKKKALMQLLLTGKVRVKP